MAQAEFPGTGEPETYKRKAINTYQRVMEVYQTIRDTTIVKRIPGNRPRVAYDWGKDMMARQIYSEKRSAAVFWSDS